MPTAVMREIDSLMLTYNHFEYYYHIFSLSSVLQFTGTDPNGSVWIKTSRKGPAKILKQTSKITELDQEGLIHTV